MQPLRGGTVFTCQNPGHLGKRCPTDGTHPLGGHADPDPTRGHRTGIPVSHFGHVGSGLEGRCCLHHPQAGSGAIHLGKHQRQSVVIYAHQSKDRCTIELAVPLDDPMIVVIEVGNQILDPLNGPWVKTFPFLAPPPFTVIQNLAEPAVGQWWLLGLLAVLIVFNFLVGEELIFRGILLPKMNGVFGKWDFIANGILFVAYHLHLAWQWPLMLLYNWIRPWATKRFKSYWVALLLHGFADSVTLIVLFTLAIIG